MLIFSIIDTVLMVVTSLILSLAGYGINTWQWWVIIFIHMATYFCGYLRCLSQGG